MRKKKIETLGIFGDSYADTTHGHRIRDTNNLNIDKAWVNILANDYNITNYAKAGSSIYYSYKLFTEHYIKYDKIIFIVTGETRYHDNRIDENHRAPSLIACKRHKQKDIIVKLDQKALDRNNALEHYYTFLQDDTIDKDIARLMIEEIKRLRLDTILVAVEEGTTKKILNGTTYLSEYYHIQFESLSSKVLECSKVEEIGCYCHLTPEYNQLLYTKMKEALVEGEWTTHTIPLIKHEREFDWYFRPRET